MTDLDRRAENYLQKSMQALVGFVGSYIFLAYVFMFLGLLLFETDLTWPEEKRQSFILWLTFGLACGFAVFTVFYGSKKLSRFWLWFLLIFSLSSLIQVVPEKGSLHVELNQNWPQWTIVSLYVQSNFHPVKLIVLAIHASLALGLAWLLRFCWSRLFQSRKALRYSD